jgi:hypothetical protein
MFWGHAAPPLMTIVVDVDGVLQLGGGVGCVPGELLHAGAAASERIVMRTLG